MPWEKDDAASIVRRDRDDEMVAARRANDPDSRSEHVKRARSLNWLLLEVLALGAASWYSLR